jgi:predicted ribosomally synthesized peptide with nif11-like leader
MSQESFIQFFDTVAQNQKLQASLNHALATFSPKTLIKIAKENGFNFTLEDIEAVLNNQLELSPEQLNAVAGGMMFIQGRPSWVENQPYRSRMQESLGDKTVSSTIDLHLSAVETFRSLTEE